MIFLIGITILMALICITKKPEHKFELVTNMVFSVIFLILAMYIWKGGSL